METENEQEWLDAMQSPEQIARDHEELQQLVNDFIDGRITGDEYLAKVGEVIDRNRQEQA